MNTVAQSMQNKYSNNFEFIPYESKVSQSTMGQGTYLNTNNVTCRLSFGNLSQISSLFGKRPQRKLC